jgi:hypothetical protein
MHNSKFTSGDFVQFINTKKTIKGIVILFYEKQKHYEVLRNDGYFILVNECDLKLLSQKSMKIASKNYGK